ncbi:hypothetical protein IMSHALPRED_008161 [Imshaugia aleurites]|uniref:Sodefrin-like factor n=1 Tax=Imshaugia aleurites TaxID=172621 RepID=A0A8H3FZL4_9LECA|nr:hypothetical protein IMSHALPRED_008161 [Imshaugia aleurites]
MFTPLASTLSTIHLALLLLATPATSDPCTFSDTAACNTQDICTPIEYTECLIAHNSISASIACIGEANKLLNNWWNEPANPNTCDNKNPDADDDTTDIDNFVVSFGQEFVNAAQKVSCNCSPGLAINDCHIDWTDDVAFAKCLCQDGVSNDDMRCLHSWYVFADSKLLSKRNLSEETCLGSVHTLDMFQISLYSPKQAILTPKS